MTAAAKKNRDDTPRPRGKSRQPSAVILLVTAADTTWRMFVPTLGGTVFGLWLDGQLNSEPWFSISGLALGTLLTALLIHQQYKKVNENV